MIDNIESTINGISDELFNDKNICNWELEAQIFHFLHSLDKWFINPAEYNEQQFFPAGKSEYSKDELLEYFFY